MPPAGERLGIALPHTGALVGVEDMTVVLTGRELTLADVVAVARFDERVEIADEAVEAMLAARALADLTHERGLPTYGLTTGLGAQKRTSLAER